MKEYCSRADFTGGTRLKIVETIKYLQIGLWRNKFAISLG